MFASRVFFAEWSPSAVTLAVQAPGAHGQAKLGQYRRALDRIVVEALGRRCLAVGGHLSSKKHINTNPTAL